MKTLTAIKQSRRARQNELQRHSTRNKEIQNERANSVRDDHETGSRRI